MAFSLTCKDLYTLLIDNSRRSLEVKFEESSLASTTVANPEYQILSQKAAVITVACPGSVSYSNDSQPQNGDRSCDCGPTSTRKSFTVKELFSLNDYKEVTLSGHIPTTSTFHDNPESLPIIWANGFRAIRLETFRVELSWTEWDFRILGRMSVTELKHLKIPISLPSDCVKLGKALASMPNLVSLAITDIPDQDIFILELENLGKGILSCASTLRELDIEMTNFNRLPAWGEDEQFVEPEEKGFFFSKFFAHRVIEEPSVSCERLSPRDTMAIAEASLRLTKLRLKHISLPSYSFGEIFDASTIKHIHLPYSLVDEKVWEVLGMNAQLDTLTEISYEMLSAEFLYFLDRQSSLKELTFVHPQDQYEATGIRLFGDSPSMGYSVTRKAPERGPDIGAMYPSLNEFIHSLRNMTVLKHLVLPADMYTITRRSLTSIGTSLTGLEDLELGFDYEDPGLQQAFASHFLCGRPSLKKVTFLSPKQPQPVLNFDSAVFHAFVGSLGDKVLPNIKLLRYIPLIIGPESEPARVKTFYHRETPLYGEWWIHLPADESERIFAEGLTPRIYPVSKWDWETGSKPKPIRHGWRNRLLGN